MKYAGSSVAVLVVGALSCAGCPGVDGTGGDSGDTDTDTGTAPGVVRLQARVLATGLENPFEVLVGPEPDTLWVTERTAKRISRVSTVDGAVTPLLTIDEVLVTPSTQDGLLGMALAGDDVFVAYTYAGDGGVRQTKIVRYPFDRESGAFGEGTAIVTGMPGSVDHNGGRLRLGPDGQLYYTIGDQGHNQLSLFCEENRAQTVPTAEQVEAQDWIAYQGKTLRIGLDGSIPADNPTFEGVRSHVYTVGHRNPQGLSFGADGRLWSVEHGPKTDDELNRLVAGGNYGWPFVAGYQDDQVYVWANWSASQDPPCADLEYSDFEIPASVPQQQESDWDAPSNYNPPVLTFGTVQDGFDFQDEDCAESGLFFLCWPSVAPSSVEAYEAAGIPGMEGRLFVTSLKVGNLYAVDPESPDAAPPIVFHSVDRLRDTAFSDGGERIWVATDSQGFALGEGGEPTDALQNPGAILELTVRKEGTPPDPPEDGRAR